MMTNYPEMHQPLSAPLFQQQPQIYQSFNPNAYSTASVTKKDPPLSFSVGELPSVTVPPRCPPGEHFTVTTPPRCSVGELTTITAPPRCWPGEVDEEIESMKLTSITAPGWDILSLIVKSIPLYYQLEKRKSVCFPKDKLQNVLQVLQGMFRTDSLIVQYKNGSESSYETVEAHCKSMEGVQFVVKIWQQQADACVAEVQRTGGDSMLFCKRSYAKRIVKSVETVSSPLSTEAPAVAVEMVDPLAAFTMDNAQQQQRQLYSLMKGVDIPSTSSSDFACYRTTDDEVKSAMSIVEELLSCQRYDRVLLGFSSLIAMTDLDSSGYTVASTVARSVLLRTSKLSDVISSLALSGHWPLSMDSDDYDMKYMDEEFGKQHAFAARTIMAQSINLMDQGDIMEFVDKTSGQFSQKFAMVDGLLSLVHSANVSPHDAYLATHILACLCRAVPDVCAQVRCRSATVKMAQHVGSCSHAALEQASDRLLRELLNGNGNNQAI